MGRLEDRYRRTLDKYRHNLALLHKKLNSMEQHEIKSQKLLEKIKGLEWVVNYHRGRECVIADIRDDVVNILRNIKEE